MYISKTTHPEETVMKAAVSDRYGPPETVRIVEIDTPEPGDDDILVRTPATSVNSADMRMRAANVPRGMGLMFRLGMGILGPRVKILGIEVAGDVEAVGRNVTGVKPGDRVLASNGFRFGRSCRIPMRRPQGRCGHDPRYHEL